MLVLFDGEKYFDKNGISKRINKFDKIIIDTKSSFELQELKNCTIFDAYNALNCKRKLVTKNCFVDLIFPKDFHFFRHNLFYLQQATVQNFESFHKDKDVFLLEQIVAMICAQETESGQWWIYSAKHRRQRIICGIEKAVVISRSLPENANIELEIEKTTTYLKRFGAIGKIKLFSQETLLNFLGKSSNTDLKTLPIESVIIRLCIKNLRKIKPVISKQFSVEKHIYLVDILLILLIVIFTTAGIFFYFSHQNSQILPENFTIHNKEISMKITKKNIDTADSFLNVFLHSHFPWSDLQYVRKEFPRAKIKNISMSNEQIKFSARLPKNDVSKIKSKYLIQKTNEEDVTICIKRR